MQTKKIFIESLGCPRNLVDSEYFGGIASQQKAVLVTEPKEADLILVNTCGFIKDAKEESLETILELAENKKEGAQLIVTGCLVQRYRSELQKSLPEVDLFLDLKDFKGFAALLQAEPVQTRKQLSNAGYAYLRISDGCENCCSYCSIPSIRGKIKSESISSLVDEAAGLAENGISELIVTAMDISQYGVDLSSGDNLLKLLSELLKIKELAWIRLLYLHPANLHSELIQFIKHNDRICNYLDLPIQHINDEILFSMNRKTTRMSIENLIQEIRDEIPEIALRTSIITGYPGETEDHHRELIEFLSRTRFNRLGVFTYSREENTPAFMYQNRVHARTALRRQREIMTLQEQISAQLLESFVGKTVEVIVDKLDEQNEYPIEGRSKQDAPDIDGVVFLKDKHNGKQKIKIGDIVQATITESLAHDLIGEIGDLSVLK